MFYQFASQDERRAVGGSAFYEIQYCRLPVGTPLREILSAGGTHHWDLTSLYVLDDDAGIFYPRYDEIFGDGVYANLEEGHYDPYSINYYSPARVEAIRARLCAAQPEGWEVLRDWLEQAREYNGIYLLGV